MLVGGGVTWAKLVLDDIGFGWRSASSAAIEKDLQL